MGPMTRLTNLREAVFDVIAPYDCLMCSAEATLVCSWCWPELFELTPPRCFSCLLDSPNAAVCSKCRTNTSLQHVWVVTPYRGGAKALVRCMKIEAQRQGCVLIARAMHESAPQFIDVWVVPVPTSTARIRERGFDHSALIAQEFARLRGLPYRQMLGRLGRTKQAGASKTERAKQIMGVYQVRSPAHVKQQKILLIDDVITTGATLKEVARVLRKAGVAQVDALVFAQTTQKELF